MTKIYGKIEDISESLNLYLAFLISLLVFLIGYEALGANLSGDSFANDLTTIGSIYKTVDVLLFSWTVPILAVIFLIIGTFGLIRQQMMIFVFGFLCMALILLGSKIVKEVKKQGDESVISGSLYLERKGHHV